MAGEIATRVLQSESDFSGAAKLREYVRKQKIEFDALFANVRQSEATCEQGHLAAVISWEKRTHSGEWLSLGTAIRKHYTNKRVRSYACTRCILVENEHCNDRLRVWWHRQYHACWTACPQKEMM